MQIYVLISVAMMLLAEERADPARATATDATLVGAFVAAWTPCLLGAVACWLAAAVACRRFDRSVARSGVGDRRLGPARRAERFVRIVPWIGLAAFAWALFGAGWMEAVRATVGDTILLDELLTLLPPMITVILCWWFLHPLQWRLRSIEPMEMALAGGRVHAADGTDRPAAGPSRLAYVLQQIRFNLLLMLVPMLAAIGLSEAIRLGVPHA